MNFGIFTTVWRRFWPTRNSKNSSSGDGSSPQPPCSNRTPQRVETETLTTNGFEAYSDLNDRLLRCIMSGKGESEEADKLRDLMDDHWYKMSIAEQDAIRRHNERVLG
jgi:hypothetical protein